MLFGLFSIASLSSAAEIEEENIVKAKNFIGNNVEQLNNILSKMEKVQKDFSLEEIQDVVDDYYLNNPVPQELLENQSLTTEEKDEMFTEKKEDVLNLNELISEAKEDLVEGDSVYELTNENGVISIYVAKTGEVMLLEQKTMPTLPNLTIDEDFQVAASWRTTRTERTTGVAYNALGYKMFTLWAEGNFLYNGSSADHANADGNVQRHAWGSTLELDNRAIGAKRTTRIESYLYPEVYTRVYFESNLPVNWGNITMSSATVEVYVGGSQTGSLYGGLKQL